MKKLFKLLLKLAPLKYFRYHQYRINIFVEDIINDIDIEGHKILDIGAENSPFKNLIENATYISHDIKQNSTQTIDVVSDLNIGIPQVKDSTIDSIICTQVLEHIRRPSVAFSEFSRILKPNGKIFLTTHMVFDEHMVPNDFFRFTKFGLISLGEDADLRVVHITPHGGIFVLLSYILTYIPVKIFLVRNSTLYFLYLILFSPFIFLTNLICLFLDGFDKEKTFTVNYEVIYEK